MGIQKNYTVFQIKTCLFISSLTQFVNCLMFYMHTFHLDRTDER